MSEKELVERLQSGDQTAVSILYDHYSPALYGIIVRIVQCEQSAEDVLQDCFVKIWKSLHSYDPVKGRLFTWLLNIARNTALDTFRTGHYRKSQCTCLIREDTFNNSTTPCTTFNLESIEVEQLTQVLSEEQKQVIDLLYIKGFTQAEAAKKLNIPLGTVKTRARSAISRLKKFHNAAE